MIRTFLKDRLAMILFFYMNTGLLILAASLYMHISNEQINAPIAFYLLLLTSFFLIVWLAVDYLHQKTYLKKLHRLAHQKTIALDSSYELEAANPPSREAQAWLRLHKRAQEDIQREVERLEQAQKRHQMFINQWVHHMKTPVSVISLLIQEGKQTLTDKEWLDDISAENDRFRHGLELMLHLARLDHFSLDLKAELVDPAAIARELINEEKRQFIRRGIFPELDAEEAEPVASDSKWLRVIIAQLLHNALKYSPQKQQARIRFSFKKQHHQLEFSIADSGVGIPAKDLPRVFDPFFTGENGRRYQESTGMGLYLAQTIARELGHRLYLHSEPGKGTTATLVFSSKTLHQT
ncbi:sensor histidine kinase [Shouchella clausii]|uniref:sensor histidine kinase n=1 Tax=Shouchella clausii TaxID=79880 RepID=UPI0028970097|nr:sensor histidine kinase [Shouchella clausii]